MSIANGLRRRTCNSCLRPFVNRPPRAATATVCRVQPCKQAEPASPFTTGYYPGDGAHVHARHVGRWDAGCNFVETAASPECHLPGSIAGVTLAPGILYQAYSLSVIKVTDYRREELKSWNLQLFHGEGKFLS